MVTWSCEAHAELQGRETGYASDGARRTRHLSHLSMRWTSQEKRSSRSELLLRHMWLSRTEGRSWSTKHPIHVSWGIRYPSRCCGDGTRHGDTVLAACSRRSFARARKCLCWQRHRSHWSLDHVECHRGAVVVSRDRRNLPRSA